MPTYRDHGIVLKTKIQKDADRYYTLFTEQHGKIMVLAKGTRRGKSKLSPHLALFGVVDIMIAKGKFIDRLAGANLIVPFKTVLSSLEKTTLAQSFLITVDALTKRELSDDRIFQLLKEFLSVLDVSSEVWSEHIRSFLFDAAIIKLLHVLGFGLELHACVRCRRPLVPSGNTIAFLHGGIECASCRDPLSPAISSDVIKVLRFLGEQPLEDSVVLQMSQVGRRELHFITDLLLTSHSEQRFSALHYLKAVTI